jgi:2-iminobutanoate/2-iminopropanoate deaminase
MSLEFVATDAAPKAIGPYSQAVIAPASRMVFCSGQIGLDPQTGKLAGAGDIGLETHQVMKNLDEVLRAARTSFSTVVKTTIYLVDLGDFSVVNAVYGTYFPVNPPARATVQVVALPRGARVEIDAIALVG